MNKSLVVVWKWRRVFTAVDEWLFYVVLLYMYRTGHPWWLVAGVFGFGSLALVTGYRNLTRVEQAMGLSMETFWPVV